MFALPGSAYVYQGEELGLPEVLDLPDDARRDPTFRRTGGAQPGRDGCRVPIPWRTDRPAFGFSPDGASWLPQPADWSARCRDRLRDDPDSILRALPDGDRPAPQPSRRVRPRPSTFEWLDLGPEVLAFRREGGFVSIANLGTAPVLIEGHQIVLSSTPVGSDRAVPADTTVWCTRGR